MTRSEGREEKCTLLLACLFPRTHHSRLAEDLALVWRHKGRIATGQQHYRRCSRIGRLGGDAAVDQLLHGRLREGLEALAEHQVHEDPDDAAGKEKGWSNRNWAWTRRKRTT